MNNDYSYTGLEIAVIGMAGRFPGAENLDRFWNNLKNGVESISFFSDEELEEAGVYSRMINHEDYVKGIGILEDICFFDSVFFGYTPLEAEVMDPQVRIFHECSYHALEDAGYDPAVYDGAVGLFAGASPHFPWEALTLVSGKSEEVGQFTAGHLNVKDFMSLRVSHTLNLRGPSYSMYSACSTSLVSIHLACQAILNGECDMALAGGVTVTILDNGGYLYQEGLPKSPDGHCRTFDSRSNGIIGGNGVGVVLLKRLEEAATDNDHIYAIIKGSAVNNDGNKKVGFQAPSVQGQVDVIKAAQLLAEVKPESISYIETHGTATALGDPIEVEALKLAFDVSKKKFCAIGSVKSNMGHTDSAAGVVGFIKTVLALNHRLIPPSLHFESPNPKLGLENSPFYVNNRLLEWKLKDYPLRAGVSSFGIGGTNAHVVLEEWKENKDQSQGRGPDGASINVSIPKNSRQYQLIMISAKTPSALERMIANLAGYFKENPGLCLADAAYTLQMGRGNFNYRSMLVSANLEETVAALDSPGQNLHTNYLKVEKRSVVFMFSGLGSQYVNMGKEIYQTEPIFRDLIDHSFHTLESVMGYDVKYILYPDEHNLESAAEKINDGIYSCPIKFIFDYSLAKLLITWGIIPDAMIGHSFGEYVVACLAGVLSLKDALTLVVLRGKLMMKIPPGLIMGVTLSEEQLKPLINEKISIAAVNSPSLCFVSGPTDDIKLLQKELEAKGHECLTVNYPRAGHSKMLLPAVKELNEKAKQIKLNKPQIPYISCLSGTWISIPEALDYQYWGRHMVETVRFSDGVKELLKNPNYLFVQVGSDKGLTLFVNQHLEQNQNRAVPVINMSRHQKEKISDLNYLFTQLGQLWLQGLKINWSAFYSQETRLRIALPVYPFDKLEYKTGGDPFKIALERFSGQSWIRKKNNPDNWFYVPTWTRSRLSFNLDLYEKFSDRQHWLLFMDERGLGLKIRNQLEQMGQTVVSVQAGLGFLKEDKLNYTIDPGKETDFFNLVKELFPERVGDIKHIIHLWGIDKEDEGIRTKPLDISRMNKVLEQGLLSLVYFVKALGTSGVTQDLEIEVITNNMQDVGGEAFLCPGKSTVLGAVKVIPLEFPNINCRSIDITLPGPGSPQEADLIKRLLVEFTRESFIHVLAYRGDERWEQTLAPLTLAAPENEETLPLKIKEKGIYLITGGLSGIGRELAVYLAKKVNAKLILISRSADAKSDCLKELEKLGAEVLVFSADVTDYQRIQEVVALAGKRFGQINGVIHSAGVPGGGSIQLKTREKLESALAAKVKGTLVLNRVLEDVSLDFFILCSSGNAFVPIFGQVDYCAANVFLDTFANYNTLKQKKFTQSINWSRWKNTGMAIKVEQKHKENTGSEMVGGISAEQGVEAFQRILRETILQAPQVIVSERDMRIDLEFRKHRPKEQPEKPTSLDSSRPGEKEGTSPPMVLRPRPVLSTQYEPPRNEQEKKLTELFQNFFGIKEIGINDDFFELGGDSLKALSIVNRIKREVNPDITLSDLLLHPTIKELLQNHNEDSIFNGLECIVKLNESRSEKNIFLSHPRHGMVYQYKDLAKLLEDDFVVYGIQARGLLKKSILPKHFEVAAADYIKQMRQVQEQGPYIIGAFCIGDMIAYNMIRQLEDMNQKVDKFIMLDEFAFIPEGVAKYYRQNKVIEKMAKPLKKMKKNQDLNKLEFERMLKEIEDDGVKNKYITAIDNEESELLKARVKQNFGVIIADYIKRSPFRRIQGIIKAPILNIKAEDSFMKIVEKNVRQMTLGKVEFEVIPGEHDTMFKSPYVEELARVIRHSFIQ